MTEPAPNTPPQPSPTGGEGAPVAPAAPAAPAAGPQDPWYVPLNLGEDLTKYLDGKNFPDMTTAFKSMRDFETVARSRDVLNKPDPANLLAWDGWEALGVPKDANAYKIEPFKPKDGVSDYNPDMERAITALGHKYRIPPIQMQGLLHDALGMMQENYITAREAQQAEAKATQDKTAAELKAEWGGDYDARVDLAKRAAQHFKLTGDDMAAVEKLTSAPAVLRMLARIGEAMGEDTLRGASGGAGAALTPAGARAELNRLIGGQDKDWLDAYRNPLHPQHATAKERKERLDRIIATGAA